MPVTSWAQILHDYPWCLQASKIRIRKRNQLHTLIGNLETKSHVDSFITACMNRTGNPFLKIPFCRESHFYQGSTNRRSEQLVTKTRSRYLPSINVKLPQGLWSLISWYFALKANRKESKILFSAKCSQTHANQSN